MPILMPLRLAIDWSTLYVFQRTASLLVGTNAPQACSYAQAGLCFESSTIQRDVNVDSSTSVRGLDRWPDFGRWPKFDKWLEFDRFSPWDYM
jgi:hypothetical protein